MKSGYKDCHLPRIAVITLGGTIASVPQPDGTDAVPRLDAGQLVAAIPRARSLAELDLTSFRQCPSSDLTLEDILELAGLIDAAAPGVDGFVITQGTDTLEETSFVLDMLLDTDRPVILTGAMRNSGAPGADGPANLLAALQVATAPQSGGRGPLVVFNDEIHLPRFVRKTHTSNTAAFASPTAGPIGWVNEGRVRIAMHPAKRTATFDRTRLGALPNIGIVSLGLGSPPVDPVSVAGFDGLVVQAFGGGHVPGRTVQSLATIAESVPVVLASRTGAGEIYGSSYAYPGSERDLLGRGLISSGMLDAFKARLLLTLLVATRADRGSIARRFIEATI